MSSLPEALPQAQRLLGTRKMGANPNSEALALGTCALALLVVVWSG